MVIDGVGIIAVIDFCPIFLAKSFFSSYGIFWGKVALGECFVLFQGGFGFEYNEGWEMVSVSTITRYFCIYDSTS